MSDQLKSHAFQTAHNIRALTSEVADAERLLEAKQHDLAKAIEEWESMVSYLESVGVSMPQTWQAVAQP